MREKASSQFLFNESEVCAISGEILLDSFSSDRGADP